MLRGCGDVEPGGRARHVGMGEDLAPGKGDVGATDGGVQAAVPRGAP